MNNNTGILQNFLSEKNFSNNTEETSLINLFNTQRIGNKIYMVFAGFSKDDIKIYLDNECKNIFIEAKKEGFKSITRQYKLSTMVNHIDAKFENGLLELTFLDEKRKIELKF